MSVCKYMLPALVSTALLAGCQSADKKEDRAVRNVILVETSQAGNTAVTTYSGIVEEGKSVNAAFMTGGKIKSLLVKEGDRVKKGQLIATLDDTDYQIGVNQLRVQFDQMTLEKKRMDEMYARHNIAPNDYEKFSAGYQQLKLQLEMADNKLGYTRLISPSDGFVAYRYMQPGELADAGTPIFKITDDTSLQVSADLPLSIYLDKEKISKAYGILPGTDAVIPLKIESFVPDADNNQLYHMNLAILSGDKSLTPGRNLIVAIEKENDIADETLVPSRAVFYKDGETFVWVFNDSDSTISSKKVVPAGIPKDNKVNVEGLTGHEKIVAAGVKQLKEGERVNVVSSPLKSE